MGHGIGELAGAVIASYKKMLLPDFQHGPLWYKGNFFFDVVVHRVFSIAVQFTEQPGIVPQSAFGTAGIGKNSERKRNIVHHEGVMGVCDGITPLRENPADSKRAFMTVQYRIAP